MDLHSELNNLSDENQKELKEAAERNEMSEFESLEGKCLRKRHEIIGKAIMKMNYWQRLWFALTGNHKYMRFDYWEK